MKQLAQASVVGLVRLARWLVMMMNKLIFNCVINELWVSDYENLGCSKSARST